MDTELFNEKLDRIHDKIDMIHEQVKCTNGRVRALESWRWGLAGGLAVLTVLVIPVLIKLVEVWVQ